MKIFGYIIIGWNVAVMLIYGFDKLCAVKRKRRVRESTLISFAYILGALGAAMGMIVFNHKTSKNKFRYLVPLAVVLNIAALVYATVRLWG